MPKIVDYPRAALKAGLDLAAAIDDLGGTASIEMAADKLGKKVSGAFNAQISASIKYGLITAKSQRLSTTPLYREIKLAYTEEERQQRLRQALLSVPLFRDIHVRFAGKDLPTSHFEKLLIREFGVPEDWGSRIASYFIDGARASGLLNENNRLVMPNDGSGELGADSDSGAVSTVSDEADKPETSPLAITANDLSSHYVVQISGPRLNTRIEIHEAEDIEIVNVMLKKVLKAIAAKE